MNILHITNGLSEGGVETLLYSFSKLLLSKGHSVTILVMSRNAVNLRKKFENLGVKVIVGKYSSVYNVLNIFLIRKYLFDFEIVHIHLFPIQLYAVLAARLTRCDMKCLITTEHNTWNNRRKYFFLRHLDRWIYKQYKYIIGISEDATAELKKWLSNEDISQKIVTINNGIEQNVEIDTNLSVSNFGCSIDDFIIVMAARFNAQKDQETLIRTIAILPKKVHVIFVGSGDTLSFNQKLVATLKLTDRVFFAGYRDDVPSILRIADLGVLCSNWEGFGLSVVEYMLAGLPVLASNVLGLRTIVGLNELLYTPKNNEELANKICRLMNDSHYYQEMRTYCINRSKIFTIEKMTEDYLSIYNKVLNE